MSSHILISFKRTFDYFQRCSWSSRLSSKKGWRISKAWMLLDSLFAYFGVHWEASDSFRLRSSTRQRPCRSKRKYLLNAIPISNASKTYVAFVAVLIMWSDTNRVVLWCAVTINGCNFLILFIGIVLKILKKRLKLLNNNSKDFNPTWFFR